MLLHSNPTVTKLALAQAIMMSVNTLLITSSAIIGYDLAEDKSLATLPIAVQYLAAMLTAIPASFFMQKFNRKVGFFFSSVIGLLGAIIALYALINQSFILFCVSTLMFGIYTGFGNYFRFVASEISLPKDRNTAISYVLVGGIAAAIIGPNLAIYSKDLFNTSFVGSFVTVFILYTLNVINFSSMQLPAAEIIDKSKQISRPLIEIIKQPVFIVALATALFGYSIMTFLMTATPLSMKAHHLDLSDIAFVIQWHVLGMFVPSLFTGHLINRFGFTIVTLTGVSLLMLSVLVNLSGTLIGHYWLALALLGVGWNFLFIGGTTKLIEAYNNDEKAKTQAINDFILFSAVTIASLSSGILQFHYGWELINKAIIPFIFVTAALILWLFFHEKVKNNH